MKDRLYELLAYILEAIDWIWRMVKKHKFLLFPFCSGIIVGVILAWATPIVAYIVYWMSFIISVITFGVLAERS